MSTTGTTHGETAQMTAEHAWGFERAETEEAWITKLKFWFDGKM